jgi:GTP1/Obg family GTP-binding protein
MNIFENQPKTRFDEPIFIDDIGKILEKIPKENEIAEFVYCSESGIDLEIEVTDILEDGSLLVTPTNVGKPFTLDPKLFDIVVSFSGKLLSLRDDKELTEILKEAEGRQGSVAKNLARETRRVGKQKREVVGEVMEDF